MADVLPASWYPDPDDSARLRWWDGAAWTEHVEDLPPTPGVPVRRPAAHVTEPNLVTDEFIIKKHIPQAGTWYAESGNYVEHPAVKPLSAAARDANDDFDKDDDIGSTWTIEMWVLAALPGVAFGLQYFLWTVGATNGAIFLNTPLFFWIIPALFLIANPILAAMDRAALSARNITTGPSAFIGLLPPVYLIIRGLTVGPSSVPPLAVWILLVFVFLSPAILLGTAFVKLTQP